MIYVIKKVNADIGGHYDEFYDIDHYESDKFTQDIANKYLNSDRVDIKDINRILWIEVPVSSHNLGYDVVTFYNDTCLKIKNKKGPQGSQRVPPHFQQEDREKTKLYNKIIREYKRDMNLEQLLK